MIEHKGDTNRELMQDAEASQAMYAAEADRLATELADLS
jgi:hypothetical protein